MSTSIAPDSRFTHRRWQRRLRSWRPWILVIVSVGVVAGVAWVFLLSSHLAAQSVTVSGARQLSEREVRAAADVAPGTPLLRLDLDRIHDRVAAVPEVATVVVHRSWPRTVRIAITEREALAVVPDNGVWWAMDKTGVLFAEAAERTELPPDLPVVEGVSGGDPGTRSEVAAVVHTLPSDLLADVNSVTARSMDSITLQLQGAKQVMWGSSADSRHKAQVLEILLAQSKADVFDVSVPQQPTSRAVE